MKISTQKLAEALAAVTEDDGGRALDFTALPYHRQLEFICEAEKFAKAINWVKYRCIYSYNGKSYRTTKRYIKGQGNRLYESDNGSDGFTPCKVAD